jgi:hypothetical protein
MDEAEELERRCRAQEEQAELLRTLWYAYETYTGSYAEVNGRNCAQFRLTMKYMRRALAAGVCGGDPHLLADVLLRAILWALPKGLIFPGHLCSLWVWRTVLPQYVARYVGDPPVPEVCGPDSERARRRRQERARARRGERG